MTESPLSVQYPTQLRPCEPATKGRLCWLAEHPDLPGCFGYGDSRADAVHALKSARVAYITQLLAMGKAVPPPMQRADVVEWGELVLSAPSIVGGPDLATAPSPAISEVAA